MINKHYVLFTRIPLIKDRQGRIHCDPLWEKDLKLHLDYLKNFSICCPIDVGGNTDGLVDITDLGIKHFFALRSDRGWLSVLVNLVPNFFPVMAACRSADIVQTEGAGWPFPLSFYVLLVRPFIRFQWVINVESSFWMLEDGEKSSLFKTISHHVHKFVVTRCVRAADARIFTQSFYRDYFLRSDTARTMINPATWIDKEDITTRDVVERRFRSRHDGTTRVIVPTRLTKDKGILVVLDALRTLKVAKKSLHVTIIGAGDLEAQCREFVAGYVGDVDLVFKSPVAYGDEFFELLATYDFLMVPVLKQEQPRVIFDAFSQGVAVIAADAPGVLDITNDRNTLYFKRGDSTSLAEALERVAGRRELALDMGLSGLEYVAEQTHLEMHRERARFLETVLS